MLGPKKIDKEWGHYTVLHEGKDYQVKELVIKPACCISMQRHNDRAELWYVIRGRGAFLCDGKLTLGEAGYVFHVGHNQWHQVINTSTTMDLVVVETWRGSKLSEDDIERLI